MVVCTHARNSGPAALAGTWRDHLSRHLCSARIHATPGRPGPRPPAGTTFRSTCALHAHTQPRGRPRSRAPGGTTFRGTCALHAHTQPRGRPGLRPLGGTTFRGTCALHAHTQPPPRCATSVSGRACGDPAGRHADAAPAGWPRTRPRRGCADRAGPGGGAALGPPARCADGCRTPTRRTHHPAPPHRRGSKGGGLLREWVQNARWAPRGARCAQ
jgi:hypothetical protein